MSAFCQLHNHCDHSLLDGLGGPGVWVDAAIEKGFSALALTDHGSVSSALEFVTYARERGITPIVGCEFYFTDDVDYRPDKKKKERFPRYHLIVLAKNWHGLQSIFAQLTLANDQFYYKPLLSLDQIYKFKNCVVMSACAVGVLHHPNYSAICHKLKDVYGDDFYLEIMPHQLEMQKEVNLRALALSEMSGIEPVATNDAHYPRVEDTLTHDVMLAIQTNSTIDKEGRFSFLDGEEPLDGLYLKSQTEMIHSFKPWIEDETLPMEFVARAIRNTGEIAAKCSGIEVPKLAFALPTVRKIKDEPKYLMELIMAGWQEKIAGRVGSEPEYVATLKYELGVITKIGAVRYFLIVHDIRFLGQDEQYPLRVWPRVGRRVAGGLPPGALPASTRSGMSFISSGSSVKIVSTCRISTSTLPERTANRSSSMLPTPTAPGMSARFRHAATCTGKNRVSGCGPGLRNPLHADQRTLEADRQ